MVVTDENEEYWIQLEL